MFSKGFLRILDEYRVGESQSVDNPFDNLIVDSHELARILSERFGIKLFKPDALFLATVSASLSGDTFDRVKLSEWQEKMSFPISVREDTVQVAVVDPLDISWQKELSFKLDKRVEVCLVSFDDLKEIFKALNPDYRVPHIDEGERQRGRVYRSETDSDSLAVKFLDQLLNEAVLKSASDIHLIPEPKAVLVKFRIHGELIERITIPHKLLRSVCTRLKTMAHLDVANSISCQDGSLRFEKGPLSRDLRLSFIPTELGESIVIRILGGEGDIKALSTLGLNDDDISLINSKLSKLSGMIIVAGPTGAGKTTTLYSMLRQIDRATRKVVTIEDPVEHRLDGVSHFQVNERSGLTFAEILRSVLRHDPDVILLGEVRDPETAKLAIQAAQTGHLVLCTVHANTPGGVISRFTGLGVSRDDIASTFTLIISQRLVKTLSGDRTGIFSLVSITRPLADAIANGLREHEFDELARRLGFSSLYDRAISLVEAGVISQEEADRFRDDRIQDISTTDSSESLKPLIMLVEDNFETAEVLAKLFESRFFEVITAQDGIDALEKLAKTSPQLIVSDIMMPRMSGIDLLKKIRSNPKTARIPVVMLTAVDTDEKELQSLEVGADDFISKAEDPQIIVARVERILTRLRFNL